jgi:hypothetical protein
VPTYKNENNGDVVTVRGAEAERLETLPNWHRLSKKEEAGEEGEKTDQKKEKDD